MKQLVILCHLKNEELDEVIWSHLSQVYDKYKINVEFRNLHELNFNPIMGVEDITAAKQGTVLEDVKIEQDYITESDYLIFVYPIWPTGIPALLKGYIDRVFTEGFAYSVSGDGSLKQLLKKKKAVLVNLVDQHTKLYESDLINSLTTCEKHVFESFGIETVLQFFLEIPTHKGELDNLKIRLEDLKQEIKKIMVLSRNSRLSIPNIFL